jgi:hypothetical protein
MDDTSRLWGTPSIKIGVVIGNGYVYRNTYSLNTNILEDYVVKA